MPDADHTQRGHGGGIDAAIAAYGGTRAGWLDREKEKRT